MVSKISLILSGLTWLLVLAGVIHCSLVSNEILDPLRTVMTAATMCSLTYFLASWVVASISFVIALIGLVFEGKSKVVYVSLILSGIIAVPINIMFIWQKLFM
jgi:hypothetical protein